MELVVESKYRLSAPAVHNKTGVIYALCKQGGCVVCVQPDTGNLSLAAETNGQPAALAVDIDPSQTRNNNNNNDTNTVSLLAADPSSQSILTVTAPSEDTPVDGDDNNNSNNNIHGPEAAEVRSFIHTYEGRPFAAPNALVVDGNGEILFLDAGSSGGGAASLLLVGTDCCSSPSSAGAARGALYRTINSRQQLTRLVTGLSSPSAVAVSTDAKIIYTAEMTANRVLRTVRLPEGGFYTSVFVQLAGSMGPVALAVHPSTDEIYIAMFDLASLSFSSSSNNNNSTGCVHVYYPNGELKGTISVPSPQISGIAFSADASYLYITVDGGLGAMSQLYRNPVA